MPAFFIDRPIFAWVVALFICLIGAISVPLLPIAQYPIIAPPSISISTSYPGASPENLYNSVTRLIEEELNGASGILNFESTSDSLGQVEIIANFVPGTDTKSLGPGRPAGGLHDNAWYDGFMFSQALTIGGGTFAVQRNIIGELVLGLPREPDQTRGMSWADAQRAQGRAS